MQISSVVVFAVLVAGCCGHIGGGNSFQDVSLKVYCGRPLARALAFLCFDDTSEDKRTQSGNMYNSILSPYYKEEDIQNGWPWISSHKARALSQHTRGKRQIVSECCLKPCSINELRSYC